jgi:hypothetical protein
MEIRLGIASHVPVRAAIGATSPLTLASAKVGCPPRADPLRIRIDATGYQTTSLRFSPCNKSVTTERRSSLTM